MIYSRIPDGRGRVAYILFPNIFHRPTHDRMNIIYHFLILLPNVQFTTSLYISITTQYAFAIADPSSIKDAQFVYEPSKLPRLPQVSQYTVAQSLFTCALKRDAQVVFCKVFYSFFRISHSPRTPLGHAHQ